MLPRLASRLIRILHFLPAVADRVFMTASACRYIAFRREFQTRRIDEDSTHLYGEAMQRRMKLSAEGYTIAAPFPHSRIP